MAEFISAAWSGQLSRPGGATGGGRQVKHSGVQAPGQEALEKLLCLLYIFCTHTHHVIYFETVLLKDKRGHIENSKHLFE